MEFLCEHCGKVFSKNQNLVRHIKNKHSNTSINHDIYCDACNIYIKHENYTHHLRTNSHKNCASKEISDNIKCVSSIFKNRISTYILKNPDKNNLNVGKMFTTISAKIYKLLEDALTKHINIKFNFELFCNYVLIKVDEDLCKIEVKTHQTKMRILNLTMNHNEIKKIIEDSFNIILIKMSEFQERDSGWSLTEILHLEININKYQPLKGSNYIPLPKIIQDKKACVNVYKNDNYCFKWAILFAFTEVTKIHNIEKNVFIFNNITINFSNINFPTPVTDITNFEYNNPKISITLLGLDEQNHIIGPYYFSKNNNASHEIYLLFLEKEKTCHYVLIKDISR